jgi:tetratricopeptide (TPR) repeat protein
VGITALTEIRAVLFPTKHRRPLPARFAPLALAFACLIPAAMPASSAPGRTSHDKALAALRNPDAAERQRGAMNLAVVGRMRDVPALLSALRDRDAEVRETAEQAVWAIWSRSGNRAVDELFRQGVEQMNQDRLDEAIAIFTRIIALKPDFAEGWNKRATAYYFAGDYGRSLKDCDEVLKRNPVHFGALAGYGQIYVRLDQPEKALEYFRRALAVNPNLEGVENAVEELEALIAARTRNTI